jgi:hypothetical protein
MQIVLLSVLMIVVGWRQTAATTQQQANADLWAKECPDTHPWTGKYQNFSYGFSMVVPEGYAGFWNSARCVSGTDGCVCMSDHGRIVPLSHKPYEKERHMEVYASHGAELDNPTVAAAVAENLSSIRKRSRRHTLMIRRRKRVSVAGTRGQRVLVRYYDKQLGAWLLEDFIKLINNGDEYSIYLRTSVKNYKHYKCILDKIARSFTFTESGQDAN